MADGIAFALVPEDAFDCKVGSLGWASRPRKARFETVVRAAIVARRVLRLAEVLLGAETHETAFNAFISKPVPSDLLAEDAVAGESLAADEGFDGGSAYRVVNEPDRQARIRRDALGEIVADGAHGRGALGRARLPTACIEIGDRHPSDRGRV